MLPLSALTVPWTQWPHKLFWKLGLPTMYDIPALLAQMSSDLQTTLQRQQRTQPLLVGIHTGGVWVATVLHQLLGLSEPLGKINIAFYRDDFSQIGLHPQVAASSLPIDINNRHVVLVDDVLYTGRTIRAALNELFDYGRPASLTLVVLVARDGRELPIQADVAGTRLDLRAEEYLQLEGPEPLRLSIQTRPLKLQTEEPF